MGLAALPSRDGVTLFACGKKCYNTTMKEMSGEGRRAWDTDTLNREYAHSSEAMLIDWLLVHGNYAKWKGNSSGISKREIQKEIADRLNKKGAEMGIQRGRTPDQVGAKIGWCETKFRETKQWIENTGQGIREEIGEDSFKEKIEKERFRHYFLLQPIMAERACMGASVTTDLYETRDCEEEAIGIDDDGGDDDDGVIVEKVMPRGSNVEPLTPVRDIAFATTVDTSYEQDQEQDQDNLETPETEERSVRSGVASRVSRGSYNRKRPALRNAKQPEELQEIMETLEAKKKVERETEREKLQVERETEKEKLQEQKRHNLEMESIHRKKVRVSVYDSIEKSMQVFLSSKKVYQDIKGKMSYEEIALSLPNCIKCFDFRSMTEDDRKKYAKLYNDFAIANDLIDRIDPDIFK